jgi:hypothetical protein
MKTEDAQPITIRDMHARDVVHCIRVRTQTREQRWTLEALTRNRRHRRGGGPAARQFPQGMGV